MKPKLQSIDGAYNFDKILDHARTASKGGRCMIIGWINRDNQVQYSRDGYGRDQLWLCEAISFHLREKYFGEANNES